ncbi:MAG TPA: DUF559 domain-containing protein [Candidatus Dormibacteraeota bacterium]|nr:DUF559 domain-containing protein [Candidatus Dormibacteraeota bacterium]
MPATGAFAGLTSAWLHGLDVDACNPIEAIVPNGEGVSARVGMKIYRSRLSSDEVVVRHGLPTTTPLRMLEDLARRLPLVEATVIADMALHDGLTDLSEFTAFARSRRGGRGLVNLRAVASHSEPKAESPMESRMRMTVVLAGLPRPEAQISVHDARGRFVGRIDLYYQDHHLGLEYDGGSHRESLVQDNRRQNRLLEAGVTLLRFTAADVLSRPDTLVAQVRAILSSAGTRRLEPDISVPSAGTRRIA